MRLASSFVKINNTHTHGMQSINQSCHLVSPFFKLIFYAVLLQFGTDATPQPIETYRNKKKKHDSTDYSKCSSRNRQF